MEGPPPTAEERLALWADAPAGSSVPVALGFGRALPDTTVAALLERYGLRPYAVYLTAAGMQSSQRREPSRASLELLGEAREQTVAQLRTALCAQPGRARAMADAGGAPADSISPYRAVLSRFAELQRALPEVELGAALVYAVEAVGELDAVRAAGSDPAVVSFEPGWRMMTRSDTTVVVPQPPAPETGPPQIDSTVAALTPEEVAERMKGLGEDVVGLCEGRTGSEPR